MGGGRTSNTSAAAAPMAEQFVAHGMSPTFISDFTPLIGELEPALRNRG